jgi:hypothetical protein
MKTLDDTLKSITCQIKLPIVASKLVSHVNIVFMHNEDQ